MTLSKAAARRRIEDCARATQSTIFDPSSPAGQSRRGGAFFAPIFAKVYLIAVGFRKGLRRRGLRRRTGRRPTGRQRQNEAQGVAVLSEGSGDSALFYTTAFERFTATPTALRRMTAITARRSPAKLPPWRGFPSPSALDAQHIFNLHRAGLMRPRNCGGLIIIEPSETEIRNISIQ
jgi:hypothetical protein